MKKKCILLVEDNPDDEALTRRALRKHEAPCDVVVVRDGAEALDFFRGVARQTPVEPQRGPDLVLLDLKMPKVSGLEVLRHIRDAEATRFLPVVVFTSSNEEEDVRESYRLGANSYIRKPVDFAEFSEAVGAVVAYWLRLNEGPPRGPVSRAPFAY